MLATSFPADRGLHCNLMVMPVSNTSRVRLSVSRALLKKPKILLLDEATAGLL
jgi:ABC-type multidrug transport system ATPase subunit